ncbi:pyridoxal phosphate-dependent transferase, partial [Clohesyomyces aquaticus]
ADSAFIVNTRGIANEAIFSAIPRPGDAFLYDELIHTNIHDGTKHSLVLWKRSFRHNDVEYFTEQLLDIRGSQPRIRDGTWCVIIAVESFYSMDGNICPVQELIAACKEILPNGNAQYVVDETHSGDIIGPSGAGLVSALGLEKEVAIRMHTFGKALAGSGG